MVSFLQLILGAILVNYVDITHATAGTASDGVSDNDEMDDPILDPWIERIPHVLPDSVCRAIIEEAERIGFPMEVDSIDIGEEFNQASWAIDVVAEDGTIQQPTLVKLYVDHYQDIIDGIVSKYKQEWSGSTAPPKLGWVFLRKYQAGHTRNQLKLHHDINLFTVNIALNGMDEYDGGGIFYRKPRQSMYSHSETDDDDDDDDDERSEEQKQYDSLIPDFPMDIFTYDYLQKMFSTHDQNDNTQDDNSGVHDGTPPPSRRRNTSEIVFPALERGDLLIHNYTLHHAIAPLTSGTRYSLVLFYDMDNPHVQHLVDQPQPIHIFNMYDRDVDVVLYYIDFSSRFEERIVVSDPLERSLSLQSHVDHVFDVYMKETDEFLERIVVKEGEEQYVVGENSQTEYGTSTQDQHRRRRRQQQQQQEEEEEDGYDDYDYDEVDDDFNDDDDDDDDENDEDGNHGEL